MTLQLPAPKPKAKSTSKPVTPSLPIHKLKKSHSSELGLTKPRVLSNVWDVLEKVPELGKNIIQQSKKHELKKTVSKPKKAPMVVVTRKPTVQPLKALDQVQKRKEELYRILEQLETGGKEKSKSTVTKKKSLKKLKPYYMPEEHKEPPLERSPQPAVSPKIDKAFPSGSKIPTQLPIQDFELLFKTAPDTPILLLDTSKDTQVVDDLIASVQLPAPPELPSPQEVNIPKDAGEAPKLSPVKEDLINTTKIELQMSPKIASPLIAPLDQKSVKASASIKTVSDIVQSNDDKPQPTQPTAKDTTRAQDNTLKIVDSIQQETERLLTDFMQKSSYSHLLYRRLNTSSEIKLNEDEREHIILHGQKYRFTNKIGKQNI